MSDLRCGIERAPAITHNHSCQWPTNHEALVLESRLSSKTEPWALVEHEVNLIIPNREELR